MRYYLASGLENHARVNVIADALNAMGHVRTYDWTAHGDIRAQGSARMRQVAQNEINSVANADFVLFLLPGGKGTHTELGAALAEKRRVILWSETGDEFRVENGQADPAVCAFYFHTVAQRIVCPFEALPEKLREIL